MNIQQKKKNLSVIYQFIIDCAESYYHAGTLSPDTEFMQSKFGRIISDDEAIELEKLLKNILGKLQEKANKN